MTPAFMACAVVNMDRRLNPDSRPVHRLTDHPEDRQPAVLTGWHWAARVKAQRYLDTPIS